MKKPSGSMPLTFNGTTPQHNRRIRQAKYISLKTLWNNRNIVASNNLEDDIFNAGTQKSGAGFRGQYR